MFNKSSHLPKDTPLHSSGLARVARGTTLGSTSTETFAERKRRDNERKHIGRYKDSHVVRRRLVAPLERIERTSSEGATPASTAKDRASVPIAKRKSSAIKPTLPVPKSAGFAEPKARGYNPYL